MIEYNPGKWGVCFIFRLSGSVFPKALVWALPNAILAIALHWFFHEISEDEKVLTQMDGVTELWSGYTFVMGFLIVFRNNQAYARFWEGATLINQVRGEWFNAVSSLIAFCNKAESKRAEVENFQNLLIRLASMLYCAALQQVCDLQDDTLEIINPEGIDIDSLEFLQDANDRCEVILQWIQRHIVDGEEQMIVKIAPPILSRVFQELSRGIVNLNNVRKIKDIPFPYPYAQMITCLLLVHWFVTPVLASLMIKSVWWAGIMCFFVTCSLWSLVYIVLEIDQPFGEDSNDLPVEEMQRDFNRSLLLLLQPLAQWPPKYIAPSQPGTRKRTIRSDSVLTRAGSTCTGRKLSVSWEHVSSINSDVTASGSGVVVTPEQLGVAAPIAEHEELRDSTCDVHTERSADAPKERGSAEMTNMSNNSSYVPVPKSRSVSNNRACLPDPDAAKCKVPPLPKMKINPSRCSQEIGRENPIGRKTNPQHVQFTSDAEPGSVVMPTSGNSYPDDSLLRRTHAHPGSNT